MTKLPDEPQNLEGPDSLPFYKHPVLDIVSIPPFKHEGTVLHCLLLEADRDSLQASVNRLFSPLGLRMNVVTSVALLTALYIGKTYSAAKPYSKFGYSSEWDIAFWALVQPQDGGEHLWVPFYMFVDSNVALLAGREIYGFPKQFAAFKRDRSTIGQDASVEIHTDFFRVSSNPTAMSHGQLLRIRRGGSPWTASFRKLAGRFGLARAEAVKRLDPDIFSSEFTEAMQVEPSLVASVYPPYVAALGNPAEAVAKVNDNSVSVPMLFLKQFRDAAQPKHACYRAAIRAATQGDGDYEVAELPGEYLVDMTASNSHPIASDIGLSETNNEVLRAFVIRQSFTMDTGVEYVP